MDPDPAEGSDRSARLSCRSRPVLARPGRDWTLLLTDAGLCFRIDRGGSLALEPLPDLDGCSTVAVDPEGTLNVGLYDAMVATLRDGEWDHRSLDAPVLSLAATPAGVAVGDAAGTVTFRDRNGAQAGSAVLGEPVVDLAPFDQGLVALGARGGLWRLGWPDGSTGPVPTTPIPLRDGLGRLVGLFDAGTPSHVGAFGSERVALIEGASRRMTVGSRRFSEGIGTVVPFGRGQGARASTPFGLLTDTGQVWLVEADLKAVSPVVLPGAGGPEEVAGLAPGANGALLAWTACGTLFSIGRDRSVRTLATGDAVLAYSDPDSPDQVAVVHWHPDRGVEIRRVWPEPAR